MTGRASTKKNSTSTRSCGRGDETSHSLVWRAGSCVHDAKDTGGSCSSFSRLPNRNARRLQSPPRRSLASRSTVEIPSNEAWLLR
jgi:hypothetical protein